MKRKGFTQRKSGSTRLSRSTLKLILPVLAIAANI